MTMHNTSKIRILQIVFIHKFRIRHTFFISKMHLLKKFNVSKNNTLTKFGIFKAYLEKYLSFEIWVNYVIPSSLLNIPFQPKNAITLCKHSCYVTKTTTWDRLQIRREKKKRCDSSLLKGPNLVGRWKQQELVD